MNPSILFSIFCKINQIKCYNFKEISAELKDL